MKKRMANYVPLLAVWVLMAAVTASAQDAAPKAAKTTKAGTIDLTADSIEYDLDSGNSVYRGNVVLKQGDMEVRGDVVEVNSRDGSVNSLKVLEGEGVVRWRAASGDVLEGRGDTIEYQGDEQELRLLGSAKIMRRGQQITGATIIYDLRRQVLNVDGGAKRARMVVETDDEQPIRSRSRKRRR